MSRDGWTASHAAIGAAVAIPAKDEEEHLRGCLAALAAQEDEMGRRLTPDVFGIVLLLNNCRDRSAEGSSC